MKTAETFEYDYFTQMIFFNQGILLLGSNHFLMIILVARAPGHD